MRQFLGVRGLKCARNVRSLPRFQSARIDLGAARDFRSAHIEAGLCTSSTVLRVHNLLDTGVGQLHLRCNVADALALHLGG